MKGLKEFLRKAARAIRVCRQYWREFKGIINELFEEDSKI